MLYLTNTIQVSRKLTFMNFNIVTLGVLLHWVSCYIGCFVTLGVLLHWVFCCIVRFVTLGVFLHLLHFCYIKFYSIKKVYNKKRIYPVRKV